MNSESGKTALITGASSGIGQELAKLFAQDGYNLILVARSADTLDRLAEVFKSNYGTSEVVVIGKDLSEENAAQDVYDQVKASGLTVNVLVNNAGLSTYGKFATETDWEKEKELIHLNVVTLTHLTKLFLKEMVGRNEGRVLNLASLVSVVPFPLQTVYGATKAFVLSFTQSMNNELQGTNVTMTALLPNATDTDFFNKAGAANIVATDDLQDPSQVARDGYNALMKGEAKVVPGGLKNKMYEVMGYVAPTEMTAAMMRRANTQKDSEEDESREKIAWGVGFGLAVLAGITLVALYKNSSPADKARLRYEAGRLAGKARTLLNNTTNEAEDTAQKTEDSADDAWSDLTGSSLTGSSLTGSGLTGSNLTGMARNLFAKAFA